MTTEQTARPKPLFKDDPRSKRVIFVPHCLLNQNARLDGSARHRNVMTKALEALTAGDVGIIQMPCPELKIIGLDRRGAGPDLLIRETLEGGKADAVRAMAEELTREVKEYRRYGFSVLGVTYIEESPGCEPLTNAMRKVFDEAGLSDIPFVSLPEHRWEEGAARIRDLVTE